MMFAWNLIPNYRNILEITLDESPIWGRGM